MKKGICKKHRKFYGQVTVTERGQIVISADIRADLGIENGDKLLLIKRKDGKGVNLIKVEAIDDFLNKFSEN